MKKKFAKLHNFDAQFSLNSFIVIDEVFVKSKYFGLRAIERVSENGAGIDSVLALTEFMLRLIEQHTGDLRRGYVIEDSVREISSMQYSETECTILNAESVNFDAGDDFLVSYKFKGVEHKIILSKQAIY